MKNILCFSIIILFSLLKCLFSITVSLYVHNYVCNMVLFSLDGSEGDYEEETELFEQECDDFMKEFVAKIFLEE